MNTKRRAVPAPNSKAFDAVVKERLELIAGERGTRIAQLSSGASTADIINKINAILDLLQ